MSDVWLGRRFGPQRAQQDLGMEKAIGQERFAHVLDSLMAQGDRSFFHAEIPNGVEEGSELSDQIEAYTSRVPIIRPGGSRWTQRGFNAIMDVQGDERFAEIKQAMTGRFDPSGIEDPTVRELFEVFLASKSADEWVTWRQQHFDGKYADGTTLRGLLVEMQMHKTEEELRLLQRAIDITTAAHREAMRSIEPGMHEYEVEALVEYIFRRNGAEYAGFPSIVGSGENSVILHYNTNRKPMRPDELVVMDIGAEYHGYSADITRTVPVDGTFSDEQRAIYSLVLNAQQAGIEAAQAGSPFSAPQSAAHQSITDGLRELGLVETEKDVRKYFMHGTSHYLGLRVHDVGTGGSLEPGQVITVEPGIYISPAPEVDPKWWNIGVRIEDDVLITATGPVVMSADAPKTTAEIEALMRERGLGNLTDGKLEAKEAATGSN
jgi:Xaa-Pro aminopeptidase